MSIFGMRPNIEKLSKKGDVVGLIKALGYKDEGIRGQAAISLIEFGDEKAAPSLLKAFLEDTYYVSKSAARALLKIKNQDGMGAVIAALSNQSEYIRQTAAEVLGENKVNEAIPALTVVLTDDRAWWIRKTAAEALEEIGWQPETDAQRASLYLVHENFESCVCLGKSAVKPLIDALESRYDELAKEIRSVISGLGLADRGQTESLGKEVGSQIQIMYALEKIGGAEASAAIEQQKQHIFSSMKEKMSNVPVLGIGYGDYWFILGLLVSMAKFPIQSSKVADYINTILAASCEKCGISISQKMLSTFLAASHFLPVVTPENMRSSLQAMCCPSCGFPRMRIRLKV
jgi:hypothetical protein